MTYDWRTDSIRSWQYALHMLALACGSRRFTTCAELYWQEQHGVIP